MLRLTREGCAGRRSALLARADVEAAVVINPRHIQYLSGFFITPFLLNAWGLSFLVIDRGESTLVVPEGLAAAASAAHVNHVESFRSYDGATLPGRDPHAGALAELDRRLEAFRGRRVGIETGWFPFGVALDRTVDLAPVLHDLRRVKEADELALIREALQVTEAGHRAGREVIRPGITELDLYAAIHAAMVTTAGGPVLPLGDFVSGERAEQQGGPPTSRRLEAGELMIIDLFPLVNGYRGDNTATLAVDRTPTEAQRTVESALTEAMAAGASLLRPGRRASEVYGAVRDQLASRGLAGGFPHHAGHGLGLGHPEAPFFVPGSDEVLRAGEVVTLEPGWYGKGTGARIEHDFLVTDVGPVQLSHHRTSFA